MQFRPSILMGVFTIININPTNTTAFNIKPKYTSKVTVILKRESSNVCTFWKLHETWILVHNTHPNWHTITSTRSYGNDNRNDF
jgi:hypothetical protein